ncbi:cytochrome P450 [Actinokineospora iranica]|uniref:Cytochrome P450 n=1 Tax=Actinokineospora iranica TaxID=1271860 RepID=A0A1G6KP21_9PSEU|nr:cytochrome P450 [Actinokineospora iranica]SDC32819.1 Cytochrome P450 [Actinokineospora iranica]
MTTSCPVWFYQVEDLPGLEFDAFLARMLREEPVARIRMPHGQGEAWLVTRYEDVKFVTSDPRFSRAALPGRPIPKMTAHNIPLDRAVSFADPPEHARVRTVVASAFSQPAVDRLRPTAERVVGELVDAMVAEGSPGRLVEQVTSPFPVTMIGTMMGVPEADWPQMIEWAGTLLSVAPDKAAAERTSRVKEEVGAYFRDMAARRLAEPRDDLMSVLAAAVDAGRLSEEELLALAVLLQFNGWHAVRNNSSMMMYTLLTHPPLWERLVADPDLAPRAVEELLRYIPHKSGLGQPRITTEDVEVGGVLIRKDEVVYVSYLTANRDEDVFGDPDRIDFDRQHIPHLAFGHGPHYCMAPMLAKMESDVLLRTLAERLPRLRLAVPFDQVPWPKGMLIRGPVELPVTW